WDRTGRTWSTRLFNACAGFSRLHKTAPEIRTVRPIGIQVLDGIIVRALERRTQAETDAVVRTGTQHQERDDAAAGPVHVAQDVAGAWGPSRPRRGVRTPRLDPAEQDEWAAYNVTAISTRSARYSRTMVK